MVEKLIAYFGPMYEENFGKFRVELGEFEFNDENSSRITFISGAQ